MQLRNLIIVLMATQYIAAVEIGAQPTVTVAAASAPVPWKTLADLPRGAWYRGIGPAELRDLTAWQQATTIDPPLVEIQGRWYLPKELLERFEWTADPYVAKPLRRPCGFVGAK